MSLETWNPEDDQLSGYVFSMVNDDVVAKTNPYSGERAYFDVVTGMKIPEAKVEEYPDIVYYKGAKNHYNPIHDVVVLDENLKDYPLAHEYVRTHELEHVIRDGFFSNLLLEIKTDINYYFRYTEEIKEFRQYVIDKSSSSSSSFDSGFLNVVRSFYTPIIVLISFVYNLILSIFYPDHESLF